MGFFQSEHDKYLNVASFFFFSLEFQMYELQYQLGFTLKSQEKIIEIFLHEFILYLGQNTDFVFLFSSSVYSALI